MTPGKTRTLDGAELAILANRFEGIASKMGNTLLRTGRSGVLNRARDFSCCIVTRDCQLLVAAESLPAHVLGAEMMVRSMHELHPDFKPGDAFLHNSPYHGSTHAADHSILIPVFDDNDEHHFTVMTKAHQADTGNSIPTTYYGDARDVYQEGTLIFPCVRVQENGELNQDIIRMSKMRIRVPEQWYGDFLGMLGSARIGEREIRALGAEVGWDSLHAFTEQWLDYSEQRMIATIRQMTSGEAVSVSVHDHFPGTPEDGIPVKVKVRVLPDEARIEIDLRDNLDNLPCGLNQTECTARTGAMIGLFNSVDHTIPKNGGSQRRIDILLRENCITGVPRHPVSCSVATSNINDRIINATQTAIAKIMAGAGMAEHGTFASPAMAVVSGVDPRTGKRHVNQLFLGGTSCAGGPTADGWLTLLHGPNGGMSYQDSIELDERYQPFIVWERFILPDTEGPGRRTGAPSVQVAYGPQNCELEVGYVMDGIVNPAKGVLGGESGAPGRAFVRRADGSTATLPPTAQIILAPDEVIFGVTQAGGGYGPPWEREPERVLEDVQEGNVSQARARDVYRVAITDEPAVDWEATRALRSEAG